jgi:hypothetical protein
VQRTNAVSENRKCPTEPYHFQVDIVLDFVSQVRDTVLMSVYLEVRNLGGSGFWNEGLMSKGREMGSSVYKQSETEVDGSCHSKEGSK